MPESPPPPPARPTRKRGGCLRKLAISAISLLAAFVAAELSARPFLDWTVAQHEPNAPAVVEEVDDKHLRYVLKPGASATVQYPSTPRSPTKVVEYVINADGFRDPRLYARPKPEGTVRIAVLGDSFTFGVGVAAADTFPKALEELLRERVAGVAIEAMNCGVYGYNTRQEIAFLQKRVLEYEPDFVLLCFYMNDVVPIEVKKVGRAPEATVSYVLGLTFGQPRQDEHVRAVEELQWWLRRRSVLLDHLAAAAELRLRVAAYNRTLRENWGVEDSPGWKEIRNFLSVAPDLCRNLGAEMRLVLFPDLTVLGEDYPWRAQHALTQAMCESYALPFDDLLPFVEHEAPASLQVHEVDHHPNERCHRLVAEGLAGLLEPRIRALAAGRDGK